MFQPDPQATVVNHRHPIDWRKLFSPLHTLLQTLIAALIFSAHELDRIFNLWFALVVVIGIPTILVAIIWIVGFIKNLILRRWLKLASVVIAPCLVWPVLFLLLQIGFDAHWIRFQFNQADYKKTIQSLGVAHPKYHTWDWGSTGGAAAPNIMHSLVYDESGRVSHRVKENVEGSTISVRWFGNHFYLVTQIHQ